MQKSASVQYNLASLFFIGIMALLTWGFYNTYIIFFPSFENFVFAQHFHGIMMMTWMIFLILQPFLIRTGRAQIHRAIGKSSYVVAPLLVLSIFMVSNMTYHRSVATLPETEAIAQIALPIPNMLAFAVLYVCAIVNRKESTKHMRYMIGTSLLMIGPGLGRALIIYYGMSLEDAVNFTDYLVLGIAAALFLYDLVKRNPASPYAVVLAVLAIVHAAWMFKYSPVSQAIWGQFAKLFF